MNKAAAKDNEKPTPKASDSKYTYDVSSIISEPSPPPSYSSIHLNSSHVHYIIGDHDIYSPLVPIASIKAHLSLLHAFKNLRTRFVEIPVESLPEWIGGMGLGMAYRWEMLATLAVERCVKLTLPRCIYCSVCADPRLGCVTADLIYGLRHWILHPIWYQPTQFLRLMC